MSHRTLLKGPRWLILLRDVDSVNEPECLRLCLNDGVTPSCSKSVISKPKLNFRLNFCVTKPMSIGRMPLFMPVPKRSDPTLIKARSVSPPSILHLLRLLVLLTVFGSFVSTPPLGAQSSKTPQELLLTPMNEINQDPYF